MKEEGIYIKAYITSIYNIRLKKDNFIEIKSILYNIYIYARNIKCITKHIFINKI